MKGVASVLSCRKMRRFTMTSTVPKECSETPPAPSNCVHNFRIGMLLCTQGGRTVDVRVYDLFRSAW